MSGSILVATFRSSHITKLKQGALNGNFAVKGGSVTDYNSYYESNVAY